MAGNLVSSLYAPIVSTFQRAFPNTEDATVYFTYSPLNNIDLIQKIHISVVNQKTNENALADTDNGILIYEAVSDGAYVVNYDPSMEMYYVNIPASALKSKSWNINQFYKVQLRLDGNEDGIYSTTKEKTAYLTDPEKQNKFSEWSTVTLLRPILPPTLALRDFIVEGNVKSPSYNKGIIPISGQVIFGNGLNSGETETLQSFVINVYPSTDKDKIVLTSGRVYTGDSLNPNEINYKLDVQTIDTEETVHFYFEIILTTKNQYVFSETFSFEIADYVNLTDFNPVGVNADPSNYNLLVTVNNEEGIASFRFRNFSAVYGNLYIKRSSSVSNFKDWESIWEGRVSDTLDMTITDNTIGSHIWYRYSLQMESNSGAMSQVYYTNIFFPEFYDAFLTRQDKQLPLRYDFKVSSVRPIVNRTKIDTLGGKYPKFAENAVLNYKQFSITGTISAEGDWHQLFLNKRNFYGNQYNDYRVWVSENKVPELVRNDSKDWIDTAGNYLTTTQNDWFWEREFREAAVAWLNDGEPKLFRSMTEGIMPVMITDINLTPKQQLDRMLYDFSATMYEVEDGHSLSTLDSLGIIDIPYITDTANGDIGGGQPSVDYRTITTIGQLYKYYPLSSNDIIKSESGGIFKNLESKYNSGGVYTTKKAYDPYLKNVKIQFHNEPHIFLVQADGKLQLITTPTADQIRDKKIQLGYVFNLQTSSSSGYQEIFVNSRGYYQIPNNLNVTGISFPQYSNPALGDYQDQITIDYILVYKETAREGTIVSGQSLDHTLIGQYQDVYQPNQFLGEKIRAKYNYITKDYTQRMQYWRGICLDVTPYSVVHLKYNNQAQYYDYIVGSTGVLHLMKDFIVDDMCFLGRRMTQQPIERQKFLSEHEFVRTGVIASSIEEITKPMHNSVYTIGNEEKIYINSQWYDFTDSGDGTGIAAVEVEGAINFLGDVVQITY